MFTHIKNLFGRVGTQDRPVSKINRISFQEFEKMVEHMPNAIFLDVRKDADFSAFHLPKAVHNDIGTKGFRARMADFNKSTPVFVYAHKGWRAQKAFEKLTEVGFKTIFCIEGGLENWRGQDFNFS